MKIGGLMRLALAGSSLMLSGCEVANSMRDDLARLTAAKPAPSPAPAPRPAARPTPMRVPADSQPAVSTEVPSQAVPGAAQATLASDVPKPTKGLAGRSESEVRSLLGPPQREDERPPGKQWHYRLGTCTVDVQLFPDVRTKQFGTLAYEVRSDDNSDEGKRRCMAELESRLRSH
ncbi:MAG: hypothetical protein ACOY4R_05040 [Pseudomonadota bacterium]